LWLAPSSEFTRNPIPKFLEPLKQLAQQELDRQVPQEFQNKREKIRHVPLPHEQKKVAGGCGCQPLVESRVLSSPAGTIKNMQKQKRQTEIFPAYAVNELPQPQLLAALGFWKTNP
jgi:hypothetical protein